MIDATLPSGALERDIAGVLRAGVHLHTGARVDDNAVEELARSHDALYMAGGPSLAAGPHRFVTGDFGEGIATVVEAVAEGRRIAAAICRTLAE